MRVVKSIIKSSIYNVNIVLEFNIVTTYARCKLNTQSNNSISYEH